MSQMPVVDDVSRLYAEHYVSLVRLAVNLVDDREAAEDVVQDVFASLSGKTPLDDPLHYLRRAVLNRARSELRRRRVVRAFVHRWQMVDVVDPADAHTLRNDRRRVLLAAIDRLPRRQREVVVLRYYEDLAVNQIAELLGISAGAVSSALTRALDTLQTTGNRDDY